MSDHKRETQEILDEMESYLNQVKSQLFSSDRIIVERTKLQEFIKILRELNK